MGLQCPGMGRLLPPGGAAVAFEYLKAAKGPQGASGGAPAQLPRRPRSCLLAAADNCAASSPVCQQAQPMLPAACQRPAQTGR